MNQLLIPLSLTKFSSLGSANAKNISLLIALCFIGKKVFEKPKEVKTNHVKVTRKIRRVFNFNETKKTIDNHSKLKMFCNKMYLNSKEKGKNEHVFFSILNSFQSSFKKKCIN